MTARAVRRDLGSAPDCQAVEAVGVGLQPAARDPVLLADPLGLVAARAGLGYGSHAHPGRRIPRRANGMLAMTVGADGRLGYPLGHCCPVDALDIRSTLPGVALGAGAGDILPVDGGLGVIGPAEIMTLMAVVARGRRLARRHGPAVHALLIELVRLGDRDVPALHQGPVGMAATARLGRAGMERRGFRIRATAETMGCAVTIEAQRGVLDPPGQRAGMDAREVRPGDRPVAGLAGFRPQRGGRRHRVGSVAALAGHPRGACGAPVDAGGISAGSHGVALLTGDGRQLLSMGNLGDAGVTGRALQAAVDRPLEDRLVREEGDRLPRNLLRQALVGVTAETILVAGPPCLSRRSCLRCHRFGGRGQGQPQEDHEC